MTLRDLIIADASAVFLDTDAFAVKARHYKAGLSGDYETITVVVVQDDEIDGRHRTGHGDLMMTDDMNNGSEIRRPISLEMLASIEVTEEGQNNEQPHRASVFRWTDEEGNKHLATAKRVIGRDHAMQTVLCIEVDRRSLGRADK